MKNFKSEERMVAEAAWLFAMSIINNGERGLESAKDISHGLRSLGFSSQADDLDEEIIKIAIADTMVE